VGVGLEEHGIGMTAKLTNTEHLKYVEPSAASGDRTAVETSTLALGVLPYAPLMLQGTTPSRF
jgi:hypothetical protein